MFVMSLFSDSYLRILNLVKLAALCYLLFCRLSENCLITR